MNKEEQAAKKTVLTAKLEKLEAQIKVAPEIEIVEKDGAKVTLRPRQTAKKSIRKTSRKLATLTKSAPAKA